MDTGKSALGLDGNLAAALGYPIAGDVEYGGREEGVARPMLHAWRLRLRHPRTGAAMSFETPPPADFEQFWARLK